MIVLVGVVAVKVAAVVDKFTVVLAVIAVLVVLVVAVKLVVVLSGVWRVLYLKWIHRTK